METWTWIAIVVAAVIVTAVTAALLLRRRKALQSRFGSEYERIVESEHSRRRAERELREREDRRAEIDLRPLSGIARDRYVRDWRGLQGRFVDRPQIALAEADELVTAVMREVGYPDESFDSRAALVSVDHADVVDRYREGHAIYLRALSGLTTTEELRRAVMAYRTIFERLVGLDAIDDVDPRGSSAVPAPHDDAAA